MISIIAALDKNGLIGKDNRMPWNIPEDLAWFRQKTLDHTIIMGRNTWLSLGRTLDRRTNVILSRESSFSVPGTIMARTIEDCLELCNTCECFVIGGGFVFSEFMPFASKMFLTRIDAVFEGDVYFPQINANEWQLVYFEDIVSRTGIKLSFQEYRRITQHQVVI